ncbi:GumC family protein [Oceanisphaera avium]|nr:polysaccharide biosynthesis tyrosine autokinase [Oceanisphaera avium]
MKKYDKFELVENNHADEANVLALLKSIFRHKWSIAAFVFVVALFTTLIVSNIQTTYRASNTLLIEQSSNNLLSIEHIYGTEVTSTDYLQTQFGILRSRSLIERVVRELDLTTHPELDPRQEQKPLIDWKGMFSSNKEAEEDSQDVVATLPEPTGEHIIHEGFTRTNEEVFDDVVNNLSNKVFISPVTKTQLVEVHVEMHDAAAAVEITNALAKAYIESELDAKQATAKTATIWMEAQLEELKEHLHDSEQALQDFLEEKGLVNLNGITTISADQLTNNSTRLSDGRRAFYEAESMYRQVANIRKSDYMRLASVPAVMADPVVTQFKAAEATASSKVEELKKRYGNQHPLMIAATTELASAQANLRAQVEQVVASIENSYQLAKANNNALTNTYEENKDNIQDITRNEFKVRELQREVETNRSLYDTFLTRLKETTARQSLETAGARIIDEAVFPKYPIKPKKKLIVALASVVALIIGIGFALLIEALSNRFRSTADLETKLRRPVMGVLPAVKNKRSGIYHAYLDPQETSFADGIRNIRTNLILSQAKEAYKTIFVTSTAVNEGKSTVANNLAIALGSMERVLLIDSNLRDPIVAKNYQISANHAGLIDLISGKTALENCVVKHDGIDIMPTGVMQANALDALSSPRFVQVLNALAAQYDRIVIDGPAAQEVGDALILSRNVDAVIYVVNPDDVRMSQAQTSLDKLIQIGAPVKGVVMNT